MTVPAAPVPVTLPVYGSAVRFPVRRIFCVGRNYAEHSLEMGGDPTREAPFFFTKPADAVVESGATIPYPPLTADLHHEAELVVAIGTGGADIPLADAPAHIWGHAAGNDLTRRDLQAGAKAARRPWDMAKGFDNSAVIGLLHRGPLADGAITCTVDGRVTQSARLSDMIWSVPEIIAHLSTYVTLRPGDLIFTGTPAGVGPIARGQTCTVAIDGLSPATVTLR
ncbi:fumarylacetoacetate hydrolase family protein [Paragemmobacter straminiformis]|uniref:Fumarylacetoacetate hydrolase family protein n=1 Tax=Paragemmobacter straminiformis TaxID=2045119 RepID=A0A842I6E8_9RHOB|nr:fumarylacetoacetate hydrolase family protein [Gemmobacter straminiformis]MBC2834644.1 fumarylacetoacetate hydrolase family protein [Gemmobacter straminiformis]